MIDLFGQVKTRHEMPLAGAAGEEAVRLAVGLAEQLANPDRPVLGIGVGTPGVVDGAASSSTRTTSPGPGST